MARKPQTGIENEMETSNEMGTSLDSREKSVFWIKTKEAFIINEVDRAIWREASHPDYPGFAVI
jgi:hypothetical protein